VFLWYLDIIVFLYLDIFNVFFKCVVQTQVLDFWGLFSGQSVFRGVYRPVKHTGLDLTWSRRCACTTGLLIGVRRKPSDRSWLWIRMHPTAWTRCCPIHHHLPSIITVAQIQVRCCCCANTHRLCSLDINIWIWMIWCLQVLFIHHHCLYIYKYFKSSFMFVFSVLF